MRSNRLILKHIVPGSFACGRFQVFLRALIALGLGTAALLGCNEANESGRVEGDSSVDGENHEGADPGEAVARGGALYKTYCAFCHGDTGEGYAADQANALSNQEFLRTATDELLTVAVREGRPGTVMSAWSVERGGPLTSADIADVTAFLRSWQVQPSLDVHDQVVDGLATRGAPAWDALCAECHGTEGQGASAPSLANPWFLATASDGFLRHAIAMGRPGTPMSPFAGSLASQSIDDLVALIRSWERPPGSPPPLPPTFDLSAAVLNASGQAADFSLRDGRFVAADDVMDALSRGESLVILDARPPSDYAALHIEGAVNLPFYAVESHTDALPKDVFIVAYCGCPHAVSGQAVDALREAGFSKTAVLDEGLYVWQERGYPVVEGQ